METKICSKCGIEKPVEEFRKGKTCKGCEREYGKKYREKNREKINKKQKENYYKDIEKSRERVRLNYYKNLRGYKEYKEYKKKYFEENKDVINSNHKKWIDDNLEYLKRYRKEYNETHKHIRANYYIKVKEDRIKQGRLKRERLVDSYVAEKIKAQSPLSFEEIYANPGLIETKRNIIKTKRLIKQIKLKTDDKFKSTKQQESVQEVV